MFARWCCPCLSLRYERTAKRRICSSRPFIHPTSRRRRLPPRPRSGPRLPSRQANRCSRQGNRSWCASHSVCPYCSCLQSASDHSRSRSCHRHPCKCFPQAWHKLVTSIFHLVFVFLPTFITVLQIRTELQPDRSVLHRYVYGVHICRDALADTLSSGNESR